VELKKWYDHGGQVSFSYSDVRFNEIPYAGIHAVGEVLNNSGRSYSLAIFIISVYDENEQLIDTGHINISNFGNGSTKSYTAILIKASAAEIKKYKVQYENGY